MGKISNRLRKLFQDQISEKVINIADLRKGKELAIDNLNSIKSVEKLMTEGVSLYATPSRCDLFNWAAR